MHHGKTASSSLCITVDTKCNSAHTKKVSNSFAHGSQHYKDLYKSQIPFDVTPSSKIKKVTLTAKNM